MSKSRDAVIQQLLLEGLDHWVPVDRVIGAARELASSGDAAFEEIATSIIGALIEGDLMVAGDIGDGGFSAWNVDQNEMLDRVIQRCEQSEWNPYGEGCWLANTPGGDRVAGKLEGSV